MRVKFFMSSQPSELEERINAWLDHLGSATIIRTETRATAVAEKPWIVVTIWYEVPEAV
jgi:hypothetical protein